MSGAVSEVVAGRWRDLEEQVPDLAERVRGRFEANLHHILGTVRPDGAPRLSGTEVRFQDGEVTLGMMPGSRKLGDVRRDPRVEIHSAPLEDDLEHGDAKLAGELRLREHDLTAETGASFYLGIRIASIVRVVDDELVFNVWRSSDGHRTLRRR